MSTTRRNLTCLAGAATNRGSNHSCSAAVGSFVSGNQLVVQNHHQLSLHLALPGVAQPHQHQQQQRRWKHQAKMGKHLERLDEMAHDNSRKEADERRKKKKDKKAAKKGGGKKAAADSSDDDDDGASGNNKFMDAMMANANDGEDLHDHHEDDDDDEDESILPEPASVKQRMMKVVTRYAESLKGIRGAAPTAELFDQVKVKAYGTYTPLKSVAQIVIISPTQATATCFDPALAKDVSTALGETMGLNPSVEEPGGVVRIPIPRVSLESRQQTAALLNKRTENYRQKIRNVRNKVMDVVKKGVAGKLEGISKDDAFRVQKEIEQVTEDAIQKLNNISDEKHDSIMAV